MNRYTHVVKIWGGLGNQMFQYAFGVLLNNRTEANVSYDLSWYDELKLSSKGMVAGQINKSGITVRDFGLDIFNFSIKIADPNEIAKCEKVVERKEFQYDKELLCRRRDSYFEGYFQNEKYYRHIKNVLKKDFKFPEIENGDDYNQNWLRIIKQSTNPVFIHFRRGDYADEHILPLEYYKMAIKYITKKCKNPTFFIFGADSDGVIESVFTPGSKYFFIGNGNHARKEDWKDMVLMSACKHAIIANSTFSWWPAYLSDCKGKIVVVPQKWLSKINGLVCRGWKVIRCKRKKYSFGAFRKNIKYLWKNRLSDLPSFSDLYLIETKLRYQIKADFNSIKVPVIYDNWYTIKQLIGTDKSLIRFGDGEFELMKGHGIPFQKYSSQLSQTLKQILSVDNTKQGLLTCLPYEYYHRIDQLRPVVKDFCNNWVARNLDDIASLVNLDKEYYSTAISQIYPMYEKYDFDLHYSQMRKIWDNKDVILLTGDRVLTNIKYNIFDNTASCKTILGPTCDAYEKYDDLLTVMSQEKKDKILVFALGPAGKAIAYELWQSGYRVLDIGHIIKDYDTYMRKSDLAHFYEPD